MKKILSTLLVCFLVSASSVNLVFAEKTHAVTGKVKSFNRDFAKITVNGKSYRLARTVFIHERNRRGELEPTIHKGDIVELIFVTSSPSSGVQEITLLSERTK